MRTPVILGISVVGFGFALWLARGGDSPGAAAARESTPAAADAKASVPRMMHAAQVAGGATATAGSGENQPAVRKLDPRSDRFRNRVDEQIPGRLYGLASKCYKGGLQRDQRLDLTYRLHVSGGAVTIGDIKTVESTINDANLERCIKDTLVQAKWRDDELPDMDEEDDLFMRAAGWANYLRSAEDDDIGG